ncbi:hypothetical protein AALO_G00030780 [Alosa alosa]|uniref:Uncharacterized protein n=1 Tax=Alosa alosa TaxID=278164 RepID=A0AAV6HE89_9TELE|nr:hypothetical protein AALO_G00030780 [Alosa alosa]
MYYPQYEVILCILFNLQEVLDLVVLVKDLVALDQEGMDLVLDLEELVQEASGLAEVLEQGLVQSHLKQVVHMVARVSVQGAEVQVVLDKVVSDQEELDRVVLDQEELDQVVTDQAEELDQVVTDQVEELDQVESAQEELAQVLAESLEKQVVDTGAKALVQELAPKLEKQVVGVLGLEDWAPVSDLVELDQVVSAQVVLALEVMDLVVSDLVESDQVV